MVYVYIIVYSIFIFFVYFPLSEWQVNLPLKVLSRGDLVSKDPEAYSTNNKYIHK